ncbi:MAG: hypothetical protein WCG45_04450 [bacterium]
MIPVTIHQGNVLMNDNTIITTTDLNANIHAAKFNIVKNLNGYSYTSDGSKIKINYMSSTPLSVDNNSNVVMNDGSIISKTFMNRLHSIGKSNQAINRRSENFQNYASMAPRATYNSLPTRSNMAGPRKEHYSNQQQMSPFHSAYGEKHFTVASAYGR